MDHHLNLFRFFNESIATEFIENNLSRAFSICLTNNSFFFNEYIKAIITNDDYEYLFSSISKDTKYSLNIQIDTATIEKESFSKVYAVAMTSDKNLNMDDFFSQPDFGERKNITDIIISLKDIAIIIEVKRTGEDCKAQLYNQVLPFVREKYNVIPKRFSWQEIVRLMEKVKHVQHLMSQNSVFIPDFLQLSEIRFPHWFEPKPFNVLPFSSQNGAPNYIQLSQRMRQALSASKYELLGYSDRLGITVPFGWASEVIPEFKSNENKDYIEFYIWPGNTKQQGYQIFNKPLAWQDKKTLSISGVEYELEIAFNIKFCHFNRYVTGINYYEQDLIKPLHTSDNFYSQSGKWNWNLETEKWCKGNTNDFERFMDDHFKPEFKWRDHCDWTEKFTNTDRNYFTMSLGYEVTVFIPYSHFKTIDKNENDVVAVSDFINNVADAFKTLI